jgi:ubiquinone/menaquinone biosynthesis C-methylase UbiE
VNPQEIAAYLDAPYIAVVATISRNGTPHLTPNWYRYDGQVLPVAVQRYSHLGYIVGVDLNLGMLEVARAHTPATRAPIAWRHGDVCALPFADASFEVVWW